MMSAPVCATCSTVSAFTVPAVPTGMKAGVRTSPRGVASTPVRAAPSRVLMAKGKLAIDRICCPKLAADQLELREIVLLKLMRRKRHQSVDLPKAKSLRLAGRFAQKCAGAAWMVRQVGQVAAVPHAIVDEPEFFDEAFQGRQRALFPPAEVPADFDDPGFKIRAHGARHSRLASP